MRKIFINILLAWIFGWNCHPQTRPTQIIRMKGSDTMLILASRWAEFYMKIRPNISIYVEGGGTEQGVQALIDGSIDICTASRPLKPNEVQQIARQYDKIGMSFLVAKDALSIYLNPANPIKNLSLIQLKKIFRGEIKNWQELGGTDSEIQVLLRPPNSGTYLYFKEHVLDGENYLEDVRILPTTEAIVQEIIENPDAIGFGGIAFGKTITHIKINDISPIEENIRNDMYPVIRYLYLYTVDTPAGPIKAFIDWILKDGQRVIQEVGYIPLWINH